MAYFGRCSIEPFKIATQHLSGEKYPTISALGPLLNEIKSVITVSDDDSNAVKEFKRVLRQDLDDRYVNPNIKFLLHKASFLDPRFKTLTHLSVTLREEIFDNILEEILQSVQCVQNDIQIEKVMESSVNSL